MYFEELKLNDEYIIPSVEIKMDKIVEFARDYDPLPIHLDKEYASSTRYGDIIAPGVMSFMAVWKNFVAMDIWTESMVAGKSTSIEWYAPVYAGDILSGKAVVTKMQEGNTTGTVEITIYINNQNRVEVIKNITCMVIKKNI